MNRKDKLTVCGVALVTALVGHMLLESTLIATEQVKRQPAVTIDEIEIRAELAETPTVGSRPELVLKVRNKLSSPVDLPLTLSLRSTDPMMAMSRAMPTTQPKPAWSRSKLLKMKANETRTLRVTMDHLIQASGKSGLGRMYTVHAQKTVVQKVITQQQSAPLIFSGIGPTITSFSIAPATKK